MSELVSRPKAVLIGIDGVPYDVLVSATCPALRSLESRGRLWRTVLYPDERVPVLSGPGWATVATGVWPKRHGIVANDFTGHRLLEHPDVLTRLTRHGFTTFAALGWAPLGNHIRGGPVFSDEITAKVVRDGDHDGYQAVDIVIAQEAARYVAQHSVDAAFVYFGLVDEIADRRRSARAQWIAALEQTDRLVQEVLDAVSSRTSYEQEQWLVMVATDHSQLEGGGHGGFSRVEREAWMMAAVLDPDSKVMERSAVSAEIVDIAPTIASWFGSMQDASAFDGVTLFTPSQS